MISIIENNFNAGCCDAISSTFVNQTLSLLCFKMAEFIRKHKLYSWKNNDKISIIITKILKALRIDGIDEKISCKTHQWKETSNSN